MNKNFYLNFILTVATIALISLMVMLINAVDRVQQSNMAILKRFAVLEETLASGPSRTAVLSGGRTDSQSRPAENCGHIANEQYYDKNADSGGRLVTAIMSDTPNMNSLINNEATAATFTALCSSTLAARNLENPDKFEPLMASSWAVSPDKLSYTVTLKEGILWHDFTDPVNGKKWENQEVT
ncbi:MAG: hypothetical protein PHV59_09530, partial [Victivallales bacterium]|nr:hypothetical protein [Victivallales bacterium]